MALPASASLLTSTNVITWSSRIPVEQVDVLPSKNQALCDLIYNLLLLLMDKSRDIAMHTNLIVLFK